MTKTIKLKYGLYNVCRCWMWMNDGRTKCRKWTSESTFHIIGLGYKNTLVRVRKGLWLNISKVNTSKQY